MMFLPHFWGVLMTSSDPGEFSRAPLWRHVWRHGVWIFYLQSMASSTSNFLSGRVDYEKAIFATIWWWWRHRAGQKCQFWNFSQFFYRKLLIALLFLLLSQNKWHQLILYEELGYFALFQLVFMTDTAEMMSKKY